jgi:hypothetical protein
MNPATSVQFTGRTDCRRDGCGPLGLILSGHTADHPHELVLLCFAGRAPQDLPKFLEDPRVESLGGADYRITSGARSWAMSARSTHLHRDVTRDFFRAIPGRPVRWSERIFWRVVLLLARSLFGLRLLTHIRR